MLVLLGFIETWEGADGPDNQDASQGIFPDRRAEKGVHKRDIWCFLVLGPFLEIGANKDDVILAPANLRGHGLEGPFADVAFACFEQCRFVVFQSIQLRVLSAVLFGSRHWWLTPNRACAAARA